MRSLYALLVLLCVGLAAASIEVRSAERTLTLTSNLVREVVDLTYQNSGSGSISTAEIAVYGKGLSYLKVMRDNKELLSTFSREQESNGVTFRVYSIRLKTTIASGSSVSLKVSAVYSQAFSPMPEEITQSQRQLVVFDGSHLIASPYKIETQKTKVKTFSSNVLSFTERAPSTRSGDTIELGPYRKVAAFSFSSFSVHFENGAHFLLVSDLTREVEVSHWGNVAVEESYILKHTGSRLKGSFSRIEYMHGMHGNGIEEVTQYLPGDASHVYYRDVIGNISTSHVFRTSDNRVKFQLKPRFVMFGGWKTQYLTGYNLPASNYITVDGSRYTLTSNVINDFGDIPTANYELRFILPEGATDIKIDSDVSFSEPENSLRYTYLDTSGRPVVTVRANNLVKEHAEKSVRVSYTFPATQVLHEPLLVIGAYFSLFLIAIVFLRVDFSISKA